MNKIIKRVVQKIKTNRTPPLPENPGHHSITNGSEFKQYFGITQKLETVKFGNDAELNF